VKLRTAILTVVVLNGALSHACDLPVFRWALENWAADPYALFVYHDGPLAAADAAVIDALNAAGPDTGGLANCRITPVDIAQPMDPFLEDLWKHQPAPATPWIVARYPHALPNPSYVWSGPLTPENANALLDSPARQEIVRRLASEDTAVWVFLGTGDVKRDAGSREVLVNNLKALSKTVEIVPLDVDTNEAAEPVPWDLQFSLLDLDRSDPAEQPFIQMLLKSEDDLSGIDAPMAIPVFGRGRALYALVGGGIAPDLIEEACMYIAGRCTCEVKDQNPGIDLLMTADWDSVMGESMMQPVEPPGAALLASVQIAPAESAQPPELGAEAAVESGSAMTRNLMMAGGLGFLALAAGTALVLRKQGGDA